MTSDKYINREISWLYFNDRVLQEANDKKNPLLERFKFLGIFSNNRDEFYRVRIATLNKMRNHKKISDAVKIELTHTISCVQEKMLVQDEQYGKAYESLLKEAEQENIFLIDEKHLNTQQEEFIVDYFKENIRKHLFPLMLGDSLKYKNFEDKSVYLAVEMLKSAISDKTRFALIEIPTFKLPRLVVLPSNGEKKLLIFLEDIVRFNLKSLFNNLGYDFFQSYLIKITRESELDIDNDVLKSFIEKIRESVKNRQKAPHIRFVYDKNISPRLLKIVLKTLGIKSHDNLKAGGRYHNLKDLMYFPIHDPKLSFNRLEKINHPDFTANISKFEVIKKKDVLFHFPYHSFFDVIDFVWEAAIDPKVRAIKMTFYRVSRHSSMMKALINAARNGKQVTVFMELQARFDEADNVYWAEKLQNEGVRIIPTIPGFKVHSKLILIRRKEKGKTEYYSNISTGNYHEATAKVYSDTSLLTKNSEIGKDINSIFSLLENNFVKPRFSQLKVSPFTIRSFFNDAIDKEIENSKKGLKAWVYVKANNLVDKSIIDKLYTAADTGVKIYLIIRGICVLREIKPHVNICAFGVVDRYLEHSRIFVFSNDDDPKYYISSADMMPRNLEHRIEVVCPILSQDHKNEIQDILDIQMLDNVKARELQPGHINDYKITEDKNKHQSQLEIYNYLKEKSKAK